MKDRRVGVLLAAALLGAGGPAASARELWRRGEAALELTGSVREVAVATRGTDADDFADAALSDPLGCGLAASFPDCIAFEEVNERDLVQSLTRLRTRLDLSLGRGWSATLSYDHELRGGTLDTLEDGIGSAFEEDSFLGLERDIHAFGLREDDEHFRWRHLLYRAFVEYEGDRVRVSVGRQRIAWGVGRLWNPIDRFNAIPPLAIEADQAVGIDSVDARWLWSGFTYLQLVYAPGPRRDDAAYALRLHGVLEDVDYSLVAGVIDEAPTFGLDLDTNLGDAAVRLEAVYTAPEREVWRVGHGDAEDLDAFWQVVASIDNNFDLGSGLYVLLEHLYNENALGFGRGRAGTLLPFFEATPRPPPGAPVVPGALYVQPASPAILGGSRVVSGARHITGLQVSYELSTALRGDVLLLWDWSGRSAALAPAVVFDGWNSAQITLGAQLFGGPRLSEYGDRKPIGFVIAEWFF